VVSQRHRDLSADIFRTKRLEKRLSNY